MTATVILELHLLGLDLLEELKDAIADTLRGNGQIAVYSDLEKGHIRLVFLDPAQSESAIRDQATDIMRAGKVAAALTNITTTILSVDYN